MMQYKRERRITMSKMIKRVITSGLLGAVVVILASGPVQARIITNHNETLVSHG
jgi:hypothetical protein